jgi:uncharacterized protein (TIGR02271 family)
MKMTHTVVGLFDSKNEAQAAMQELVQQGFIQENIDFSNRSVSNTNTTNTTDTTDVTNTGSGDSISNFFGSLFGDDPAASRNYTDAASDADAILTVQVDSAERAIQAAEILDRNGAIDVDERAAQYRQTYEQTYGTTENTMTNQPTAAVSQNETAIPIIEEELQVGKREVERGGARIRSRVIEKPVEERLRLREEHIVVDRHPVNRAVTDADLANFQEGEIELTERAEVPIVSKQARVVEEVAVGKQVEEHEEVVSDTVRRTDVEVEEIDTDVTATDTAAARRAANQ